MAAAKAEAPKVGTLWHRHSIWTNEKWRGAVDGGQR